MYELNTERYSVYQPRVVGGRPTYSRVDCRVSHYTLYTGVGILEDVYEAPRFIHYACGEPPCGLYGRSHRRRGTGTDDYFLSAPSRLP